MAGPLAPVCRAGARPMIDTTVVTLAMAPSARFRERPFAAGDRMRMRFIADGIQRHFVAPASLGDVPVLAGRVPSPVDTAVADEPGVLGGRLILALHPSGRLRTVLWEIIPYSAPLANAVVRAVQVADSAGELDGLPRDADASDTLALDIHDDDTLRADAVPIMRAQKVSYRGDAPVIVLRRGTLHYPRVAAAQGVGTEGMARFVVGSDGNVVEAMTQITRAGWRDFVEPMRRAVHTSSYRAAMSGGCAVPALAQQPFTFSVNP
jgi:hypothetical protein